MEKENLNRRDCTNHVFLDLADISEDADGAAMRQTAHQPVIHVLHQFLQEHNDVRLTVLQILLQHRRGGSTRRVFYKMFRN